ncbi:MAG TPA: TlpA disulfide reductase family protein [Gemmatimonadales bacterium]|nr:TlpA disulfide reductase family protein [Gemmatimonadales bacterium]
MALALGMAAIDAAPAGAQEEGIEVGVQAPAVIVNDLDGVPRDLGAVIGTKPVLLEFWATWCTSCQAMMPALRTMREEYGDAVEFYGVNVTISETRDGVREYVKEHAPPFETLYDEEGVAARAYDPPATSYIVITDAAGKVVYTGSGGQQDLEPALRQVTGRAAGQ